jgi:hypothetical protein
MNREIGFRLIERRLNCYTDGPKTKSLVLGCMAMAQCENLSFSFGEYVAVFQAEVHAMKACAFENVDRNYGNQNIYIALSSCN